MSFISENVDRLSMLPEEILSHILSLMPTKFAVRTSILSKRWRYTWTLVTNLDFEDDTHGRPFNANTFTEFVNRVFKFCKTSHIKSFRLNISHNQFQGSEVSSWIDNAVGLNVRELDICIIYPELPLRLFTCKTITNLKIDFSAWDYLVSEFPSHIYLPCLKTLDIAGCEPLSNAFNFIHGCPVLESLSLEVSCLSEEDCIVKIPTLKRLKVVYSSASHDFDDKVVLRVPKLEYLVVGGVLCSLFEMEDVSSLVRASITYWISTKDCLWADLLNKVRGVQNLTIVDFPFTSPLPIFPNMKQVEFNGVWESVHITQFLESCPELKILCIDSVFAKAGESILESKLIPACMLKNLTTIKFSRCEGNEFDIEFLEYMLGNAHVLKTVTIYALENLLIEEHPWFCALVLAIPRASPNCEIHFRPLILPPHQESVYDYSYEAVAF